MVKIFVNRFIYWLNLKKDVEEFVASCFVRQHVKLECKHLGGLLHLTVIHSGNGK